MDWIDCVVITLAGLYALVLTMMEHFK